MLEVKCDDPCIFMETSRFLEISHDYQVLKLIHYICALFVDDLRKRDATKQQICKGIR